MSSVGLACWTRPLTYPSSPDNSEKKIASATTWLPNPPVYRSSNSSPFRVSPARRRTLITSRCPSRTAMLRAHVKVPQSHGNAQSCVPVVVPGVNARAPQQEVVHKLGSSIRRCAYQRAPPTGVSDVHVSSGPYECPRNVRVSVSDGEVERSLASGPGSLVKVAPGHGFKQ